MVKGLSWQTRFESYFYNHADGWVDGTTEFHSLVERYARGGEILEIGAGPANPTSAFLATLGKVHGIDPDPAVRSNPHLTTATVLTSEEYPFPNESIDACVSNYVVEHLSNPVGHLNEVRRVLRPGGVYVFRTVNSWHYVALISRATPDWFHKLVANRARCLPEGSHDPYSTRYAMNTVARIRTTAVAAGLEVSSIQTVEKEPWYGRFSRLTYLLMAAYERVVNSRKCFGPFRANLFVVLTKGGGTRRFSTGDENA